MIKGFCSTIYYHKCKKRLCFFFAKQFQCLTLIRHYHIYVGKMNWEKCLSYSFKLMYCDYHIIQINKFTIHFRDVDVNLWYALVLFLRLQKCCFYHQYLEWSLRSSTYLSRLLKKEFIGRRKEKCLWFAIGNSI